VAETACPRVDSLLNLQEVKRLLPRGVEIKWSATKESVGGEFVRPFYVVEDQSLVTGANLVDARAELDPLTNGPQVSFELDRAGGRKFGEGTGRHVGDFMAIVLDGRVQGRPRSSRAASSAPAASRWAARRCRRRRTWRSR